MSDISNVAGLILCAFWISCIAGSNSFFNVGSGVVLLIRVTSPKSTSALGTRFARPVTSLNINASSFSIACAIMMGRNKSVISMLVPISIIETVPDASFGCGTPILCSFIALYFLYNMK